MFGLTFLSNDKQKLLQKLEERLAGAKDRQTRNEAQLAIQELRVQAKPYTECDLLEAEELKSQLLQKLNILIGLGKQGSAEAFRLPLKDVDFHIQTLQMKETMQQKDKLSGDEPPNLVDRSATLNSTEKEKKKKKAFQHRWVVGMDDEPDLTNK